jgi:hypothetical protein
VAWNVIVLVLRSPHQAAHIADPGIRRLVETRFAQVCAGEPHDPNRHGYMIVVAPDDSVEAIERESGCPVLRNTFDDARFGDPEFTPAAEVIEEHRGCYELLFILTDDGYGIEIFVPKVDGVAPELLAMCAQFATPAVAPAPPY